MVVGSDAHRREDAELIEPMRSRVLVRLRERGLAAENPVRGRAEGRAGREQAAARRKSNTASTTVSVPAANLMIAPQRPRDEQQPARLNRAHQRTRSRRSSSRRLTIAARVCFPTAVAAIRPLRSTK